MKIDHEEIISILDEITDDNIQPLAIINSQLIFKSDVDFEKMRNRMHKNENHDDRYYIDKIAKRLLIQEKYPDQFTLSMEKLDELRKQEEENYSYHYEGTGKKALMSKRDTVNKLVYQRAYLEPEYRFKSFLFTELLSGGIMSNDEDIDQLFIELNESLGDLDVFANIMDQICDTYTDHWLLTNDYTIITNTLSDDTE